MMARRLHALPAWTGFMLAVLGLLVLVASFFLPPLYVVPCVDSCAQPKSLRHSVGIFADLHWRFSHPLRSSMSCILVLCYLPLLAAVMVVACLLGFLVRPHRAFVTWSHRVWLTGSIALVLFLLVVSFLFSFFRGGPELGFWGLMFGYGLLWAGNRVVLNSVSAA